MDALKDTEKYVDAWTEMMTVIWREKIERLKVVRSGRLHQSFQERVSEAGQGMSISIKFARYGIYQALGTGNGYTRGNGGDLKILDPAYRKEHGLDKRRTAGPMPGYSRYRTSGKPRKPRDWFSKKLYSSIRTMTEDLARNTGEEGAMVVGRALDDARNAL